MKKLSIIAVVAMLFAVLAASGAMAMTLSSTSFKDGGAIAIKYACPQSDRWQDGKNISPQLSWGDLPTGTKFVAVIMKDITAEDFLHWAFIVPASVTSVDEDVKFDETVACSKALWRNANLNNGYRGPYPPVEQGTHEYVFTAYALSSNMPIDSESDVLNIEKAANLGKASISGKFPYEEPKKDVWKIGGVWNYTATIPETKIEYSGITVTIGANETGNIDMKMTEGEEAGREYYDSAVMSSVKGNIKGVDPDGKKFDSPYELKEEIKIPFDSKKLYNPGDELCYEYTVPVTIGEEEVKLKETISGVQTEEGKVEGKIKLYLNEEQVIEGDFVATRPSSGGSSGGCNAGFGMLALLFAAPLFCRKKK